MKKIIKLILKCLLVMLPLFVLCIFFRTHPFSYIDNEGAYYLWNREFTNTTQDKQYNVVVLGDSTANGAYIPEYLSDDTVNLALGGTTPIENYYTLKDWLDHNAPPKVCYISFCDAYLAYNSFFWQRSAYSHRYTLSQTLEVIKTAFQFNEASIIFKHYWVNLISYKFYLPNRYITPFMNASFNQRYNDNVVAFQSDDLHRGRYITLSSVAIDEYAPTDDVVYESLVVNPMFDYYYRKIIDLCYDNQITVRIVKLPVADNTVFGASYADSFYAYYNALQQEYPGLTVDRFPQYPRDLHVDNLHVNAHGALRFSSELKQLYPEDFENDTLSPQRIEAIDHSITFENRLPFILQWIADKDYTVIVCDGSGSFADYYKSVADKLPLRDPLPVIKANVDAGEEFGDIYYISGLRSVKQNFSLLQAEGGLSIQLNDGDALAWGMASSDLIQIAVIDNYNGQLVCTRSFKYMDKTLIMT